MSVISGFLIVKTFWKLYRDSMGKYQLSKDVYAIPRVDKGPEDFAIQYQGLDRDALSPYDKSQMLAEIRMAELENENRCEDGFLFNLDDVRDVLELVDEKQHYEVIWARIAGAKDTHPSGFHSIGFEPSCFTSDHFSASCDCMLFPRWHGTDKEGILFSAHFRKLNRRGLFDSIEDASAFLEYYLSFDWTETGEYELVEVMMTESGS